MGDHDDLIASLRKERGADTPHAKYLDERLTAEQAEVHRLKTKLESVTSQRDYAERELNKTIDECGQLRAENDTLRAHLAGSCKAGAALRKLRGEIDGLAGDWQREADDPGIPGTRFRDAANEGRQLRRVHAAALRALLAGQNPAAVPPDSPAPASEGPGTDTASGTLSGAQGAVSEPCPYAHCREAHQGRRRHGVCCPDLGGDRG